MPDVKSDYDSEQFTRRRDTYGETAEIPRTPIGATASMLKGQQAISERIAGLAMEAAEAAHKLEAARWRHHGSGRHLAECEAIFGDLEKQLVAALAEHRQGAPSGLPDQR